MYDTKVNQNITHVSGQSLLSHILTLCFSASLSAFERGGISIVGFLRSAATTNTSQRCHQTEIPAHDYRMMDCEGDNREKGNNETDRATSTACLSVI